MATRTSSQNGNWSSSSTWGGASPPGDGDNAIVLHNVTVDTNTTVGFAVCPDAVAATQPTLAATTGGSVGAGTWLLTYAYVDAAGRESFNFAAAYNSVVVGGANNAINVTLPSLPSGVSSYNLYYQNGPIWYQLNGYQGIGAGTTKVTSISTGSYKTMSHSVYVDDTKTLTVASGVSLTIKGCSCLGGGTLDVRGSLVLDAVTSGEVAYLSLGYYFDQYNTLFKCTGSSGARASVSAPSGKVAALIGGPTGNGRGCTNLNVSYADFTRIGNASVNLMPWRDSANPTVSNCTFTNCGSFKNVTTIGGSSGWSFTDVVFINGADATNGDVYFSASAASGSPTRDFKRVVFDKGLTSQSSGVTIEDCFLPDGHANPSAAGSYTSFQRNFIWMGEAGSSAITGMLVYGGMTDCYVLADTTNGNSHILIPKSTATYSGLIFDNNSDDGAAGDNSDVIYTQDNVTVTLLNSIICWSEITQLGAGTINPNPPMAVKVRHCSGWVNQGIVSLGDLSFGTNTLSEFKSNLCVGPPGGSASNWKVNYKTQQGSPTFANAMTGAGAVNNAGYNLGTGFALKNYNTNNTDTTPGANDVSLDASGGPGCVDNLRTLGKWALARGYSVVTGTSTANIRARYADGITALKADFVTRFADLQSYIRGGWAPTNALLQNAGHDGVTIGAVEGVFQSMSASPSTIPKNHANNITITLTGVGTSWSGSTVFTPSGVTGVTKVSQNVASSTSATIVVTTSSSTGTLTITESVTGSTTATVTVATATLGLSPTHDYTGTTPSLTLTGTNTVWSQETAAGLLSVSGGYGASIATPTITTNTAGTATLTVGSASGTLTITDNSTGATASFTANPGSFTASPSTIPKNHAGNITITLTGTNTLWNSNTVFTVSGVTGVSKVSQNVASGTSATIVVTTGANTGTLTISETVTGSLTQTVTVATASMSLSPSSGLLGATPTITITGTNTVWSQETAGTLLSISGGTGASLGTPTINSNTSISVALTGGSGTGTLTITDNSTGATQTFTVAAATAYFASGPTSGVVNVAKTYTLYANGTTTATVTGHTTGTGSFAGTVALNGTSPVTLSYTPTDYADSPHTLSFTDSASLTDPSNITLTVTQVQAIDSGARMRRLKRP